MRFRLRTLFILVAVLSVLFWIISSANAVRNTIYNAYAVWWVADMVIEHMESNDGRWPKNWDDLHPDYVTCCKRTGNGPWTFEFLRHRVKIDWNVDPQTLLTQQEEGIPTFRVIWPADGSRSSWSGKEPNKMLLDYLSRKQK